MAMETGNRLMHSKSRFVSSVKRTIAFAALGFQVLISPMIVSCTKEAATTAAATIPEKDKSQLNEELLYAAGRGDKKSVEKLLAKGADVNAKNNFGETALMWAFSNQRKAVAELLITKGANVNAKDEDGTTALKYAYSRDTARFLIANGANVNVKDNLGRTPLMWVSVLGDKEVVELLISKGAKVDAKDEKGYTALKLASLEGDHRGPFSREQYSEIVALLKKHGAKE